MKHNVHTAQNARRLQTVLEKQRVPYTLNYIFQDGQRDSMEYWQFEIADPARVFNAAITSLYKDMP